ncbi:MAG: aldo/keto reductase [Ectothiorhodospiraceae bacterium]|nr:aldo/keto reductase [Chromatiales bacterium]MCP5154862.1 aldo/keto reductase [Ectothiorhodospiraceae bacterium]
MGGVFVAGREHGDGRAPSDYQTALATLDKAYEIGVRYFDTAPFYGRGRSERRFGKVLGRYPRDSFVLSTKVGRILVPDEDDPGQWVEDGIPHLAARFDLSRDGILRAFEESLARHGLERIEILYLHDPDVADMEAEAVATAFPTMVELKEQGLVRAIGTGMNQWEMPARFLEHFDLDVILLAGRYTLLDQSAFERFLPLCQERGTRIVVGGPYNSGILAARDLDQPVWFNYAQAPSQWIAKARAIAAVCARHGVDMRAAALQFPLAHPAVAAVIPGAATPEQVVENAALIETSIPDDLWRELAAEGLVPREAPVPSAG